MGLASTLRTSTIIKNAGPKKIFPLFPQMAAILAKWSGFRRERIPEQLQRSADSHDIKDLRMLESIVEFLGGLLLSALPLLIGSCMVGSILAALRAVNRESDGERKKVKEIFASGAKVTCVG
jgi:hypothetical protein